MILLIDNYDSFTHNLAHLLAQAAPGQHVEVRRNDALSVEEALGYDAEALVLSPGPGRPEEAGIVPELLARWSPARPLLGICLGHQALGVHFGARLVRVPPWHGKTSRLVHTGRGVFAGLPQGIEVMRYHSLALDVVSVSAPLMITARVSGDESLLMGLAVAGRPWEGLQFHPESYLSECGLALLRGFFARPGMRPSVPRL